MWVEVNCRAMLRGNKCWACIRTGPLENFTYTEPYAMAGCEGEEVITWGPLMCVFISPPC